MPTTTETIAPTILIGLGGIGSEVVCKVYDKVPRKLRALVPIHVFDTDQNDIKDNRKILGSNKATQTSRPITVDNYLNQKDSYSPIFQWFPAENNLIRRKTLTDGAGQLRVVSRLAYLDTMESDRMNTFARQIREMFINNQEKSTVRVFIVCSLGGGTGAGMFLQTALYLQDLLKKHGHAHIIRGAFMLPAAIEDKIPDIQVDDTRSNAYACLKELDAITRNATAQLMGRQVGPTINFEYKPEQADKGYNELVITSDHQPYNYCFLYDQFNNSGKPLPDMESYKRQMIDTIALQLFSPLSDNQFSVEDNFFRTHIRAEGGNYFCGAGAARLSYPYDDLVTYFALRQAEAIIDRDWHRIDARFAEELQQYKNDLNNGINRPEPDRGSHYLALVKDFYNTNDNFFTTIYYSTQKLDGNNRPIVSKAKDFFDAVNQLIKDVIDKDDELRDSAALCEINTTQIKEKEQAEEEIITIENNLDNYKRLIEQRFHEYRMLIINRIVGGSCYEAASGSQESYQINHWLLDKPLHPVAVRCFLYEVRNLFGEELLDLQRKNHIRKQAIENYPKKYDRDPDDNVVENAVERLEKALEQPIYYRLFKENLFAKFIKEYQDKSAEQLKTLNKYRVEKLREIILSRLKALVEQLCANWEQFFNGLDHVKTSFRNQANRELKKHDQNQDPTIRYVLASQIAKEKLWEVIQSQLVGSSKLPDDLCRQIYRDQFALFCRQEFPNRERMSLDEGNTLKAMEERATTVFSKSVLQHFKKLIGELPQVDLKLGEALKQEFELEYQEKFKDFTAYLQEVNHSLYGHAEPMVNYQTQNKLQYMTAWGINTTLEESLTTEEFTALLNLNEKTAVSQNDFFPHREAQLMRSTIGLHAEDMKNFQAPDGLYYTSYRQHIERLEKDPDREITPHLDKNWHKPAYLPDLNQEEARQDIRKKRRAFINGLIYRIFSVSEKDQDRIWQYIIAGRRFIKQGNGFVPGSFQALYESLGYNPALIDSVLNAALKEQQSQVTDISIQFNDSQFSKGCKELEPGKVLVKTGNKLNLFDAILQMVNDTRDDYQEETEELLHQAIDEIYDFSLAMTGQAQVNTARSQAEKLIDNLAEESVILSAAKQDDNEAYQGWNAAITTHKPLL